MKKIRLALSKILILSLLLCCGNALPLGKYQDNTQKQVISSQGNTSQKVWTSYQFNYPTISKKISDNNIAIIGNKRIKTKEILKILQGTNKRYRNVLVKDGKFYNEPGSMIKDQNLIKSMLSINKIYIFSDQDGRYTVYVQENPYKNQRDVLSVNKNERIIEENNTFNTSSDNIASIRLKDLITAHKTAKGLGGIKNSIDNWDQWYFNNTRKERAEIRKWRWEHNHSSIRTSAVKNGIIDRVKKKLKANPKKIGYQRVNLESIIDNKYFCKFGVLFEDYLSSLDNIFCLVNEKFDKSINDALLRNKTKNGSIGDFVREKHNLYEKELPLIKEILNSTERLQYNHGNLGSASWLSGEIEHQGSFNVKGECKKIKSSLFTNGFWNANGFLHVRRERELLKVNTDYHTGNLVKFKDIIFKGNNTFSSEKLLKVLEKQTSLASNHNGTPVSYFELLSNLQRIRDFYTNHGFNSAEFKVQLVNDYKKNKSYTVVNVHEGPYFGVRDLVLHTSGEGERDKTKVLDLLLNTNIPYTANLLDTLSEFNRTINFNTKRTSPIDGTLVHNTGFRYKNNYLDRIDYYQNKKNKDIVSSISVLGQSPSLSDYQIMYEHDKEFKTLPENYFLTGRHNLQTYHTLSDTSVDFCRFLIDRIPEYNYGHQDSIRTRSKVFHLTKSANTGVDLRFVSNLDLFPQVGNAEDEDYEFMDDDFNLLPESINYLKQKKNADLENKKYKTSYSLRLDADNSFGSGNPFFIESSLLGKGLSFTYGETSPNYLHNILSQIDSRESTKFNVNFRHNFISPSSMNIGRNWRTNFGNGNIWLENTAGVYYKKPQDISNYNSYVSNIDGDMRNNNMFLWHTSFNYKTEPESGEKFGFKNLSFNVKNSVFSGLGYSLSYNDILSRPVNIFSTPATLSRTVGIGYENKSVIDNDNRVFRDNTFDFKCVGPKQISLYTDRSPYSSDELLSSKILGYDRIGNSMMKILKESIDYADKKTRDLVTIQSKKKYQDITKYSNKEIKPINLTHKPNIKFIKEKSRASYKPQLIIKSSQSNIKNNKNTNRRKQSLYARSFEPVDQSGGYNHLFYHSISDDKCKYKIFDGDFVMFGDIGLSVPGEEENLEITPHYNDRAVGFYHNKFQNISRHLTHTSVDLVFGNCFDTYSNSQNAKIKNMDCSLKMDLFLNFLGYVVDASISDPLIHPERGLSLKVILNSHPPKYNETYCYNNLFKFPKIESTELNGTEITSGPFKSIKNIDKDIKFLAEEYKAYEKSDLENELVGTLPFDGDNGNVVDTTENLSGHHNKVSRELIGIDSIPWQDDEQKNNENDSRHTPNKIHDTENDLEERFALQKPRLTKSIIKERKQIKGMIGSTSEASKCILANRLREYNQAHGSLIDKEFENNVRSGIYNNANHEVRDIDKNHYLTKNRDYLDKDIISILNNTNKKNNTAAKTAINNYNLKIQNLLKILNSLNITDEEKIRGANV